MFLFVIPITYTHCITRGARNEVSIFSSDPMGYGNASSSPSISLTAGYDQLVADMIVPTPRHFRRSGDANGFGTPRSRIIPGVSDLSTLDNPEDFDRAIERFL